MSPKYLRWLRVFRDTLITSNGCGRMYMRGYCFSGGGYGNGYANSYNHGDGSGGGDYYGGPE